MKYLTSIAASVALVVAAPAFASTTTTINFESTTPGYQTNPFTIDDATFSTTGYGLYVGDFATGTGLTLCGSQADVYCDASVNVDFSSAVDDFSFLYSGVDTGTSSIIVGLSFLGGGSTFLNFTNLADNSVLDFSAYSNILGASIYTDDAAGLVYDNFTYSIASAAPEPGTWAMMILGFGLVGFGLRRKRKREALAAA